MFRGRAEKELLAQSHKGGGRVGGEGGRSWGPAELRWWSVWLLELGLAVR